MASIAASLSCQEVVTQAHYLGHVATMFSADCDARAILCNMDAISSAGCRGHVIVVTWSKRCQVIEEPLFL